MNKKPWIKYPVAVLLSVTIFVTQFTVAAWLSTNWEGGLISLRSSSVNKPTAELWRYTYTAAEDEAVGWHKIAADFGTTNGGKIRSIGTVNESAGTFTPYSEVSLYFGTITSLVEEQDNLPIYFKFTVTTSKKTSNKAVVEFTLPDEYLRAYLVDVSSTSDTPAGTEITGDLKTELNDVDTYPFLHLCWFVSDTDYGTWAEPSESLPTAFTEIFSDETAYKEYDADDESTQYVQIDNTTDSTQTKYVYVRMTVAPKVLANAISDTDLKSNMPAYLLFTINLGLDIRTSAYNE